jgi:hypothetical protein
MKRRILIAIGSSLLVLGGAGVVAALAWLTTDKMSGSLSTMLDQRMETLIYLLPTLMLVVAIAGAGLLASALSTPPYDVKLHPHTRFHA